MNRGSFEGRPRRALAVRASMRPRFMNRGSLKTGRGDPGVWLASMRPRFMNRGSRKPLGRSSDDARGFNEAPIHESGKFDPADRPIRVDILLQ